MVLPGETVVITEHDRPIAMLVPLPDTGDPTVDRLIRDGKLTPASNPGGVAALLAITPAPATDGSDTAKEAVRQASEGTSMCACAACALPDRPDRSRRRC